MLLVDHGLLLGRWRKLRWRACRDGGVWRRRLGWWRGSDGTGDSEVADAHVGAMYTMLGTWLT